MKSHQVPIDDGFKLADMPEPVHGHPATRSATRARPVPSRGFARDSSSSVIAVRTRVGLLEYLGRPVDRFETPGTRLTFQDAETYDDDPDLAELGALVDTGGTSFTRQDSETYDDDPGLGQLGVLDDVATRFTKVDSETYDDDPGVSGLAFPA